MIGNFFSLCSVVLCQVFSFLYRYFCKEDNTRMLGVIRHYIYFITLMLHVIRLILFAQSSIILSWDKNKEGKFVFMNNVFWIIMYFCILNYNFVSLTMNKIIDNIATLSILLFDNKRKNSICFLNNGYTTIEFRELTKDIIIENHCNYNVNDISDIHWSCFPIIVNIKNLLISSRISK